MDNPPAKADRNRYGMASTHWTTIRACTGTGTQAQAARETLCRDYWYPVYAYVRRAGRQKFDAEDLTQGFFADILSRPWLERADRLKGSFRAFLLKSLENFLRDRLDGQKAAKRGGGYQHIPLDLADAELRYAGSAAARVSPAEAYEIEWASAIVNTAWKRLEAEHAAAGKDAQFAKLKVYLTAEGQATAYEAVARDLNVGVENVKTSVHRLRRRYAAILQEEVALTVSDTQEVPGEMRRLRATVAEKASEAA